MYDAVEQRGGYLVGRKVYQPTDPRLGRHVFHDSRSLNYRVAAVADTSTLKSIRHQRYVPTFDQANLGSCTGNAGAGNLGTGGFWGFDVIKALLSDTDAVKDETVSVGIYSDATKLDDYNGTYPPDDTGSDGLSVAKVLKNRGLISGYQHATSFDAVLTALAVQPVIVGTEWLENMFDPASDGKLNVSGSVAGGHEYVLDELDVENQRIWMHNSWADSWGVQGRAWFSYADFKKLLAAEGDCTVFVSLVNDPPTPSPTPTPPTPPAPPEPTPTPSPVPNPSILNEIVGELRDAIAKLSQYLKDLT